MAADVRSICPAFDQLIPPMPISITARRIVGISTKTLKRRPSRNPTVRPMNTTVTAPLPLSLRHPSLYCHSPPSFCIPAVRRAYVVAQLKAGSRQQCDPSCDIPVMHNNVGQFRDRIRTQLPRGLSVTKVEPRECTCSSDAPGEII